MLLVLDSGIGGLTVVDALRRELPDMPLVYLADHGGFPYGRLSDAALTARLVGLISLVLSQMRPQAVVVACNTASTVALPTLRAQFPVPFIGCVPPIKPAALCSRTRRIGLLATPATVRRSYVQDLMARHAPDCTLFSYGSPTLAKYAEQSFLKTPPDPALVQQELDALLKQNDDIDTVALGCTHYPFLLPQFRAHAPHIAHWLDPADGVAKQARRMLMAQSGMTQNGCEQDVIIAHHDMAVTTLPVSASMQAGLAQHGFGCIRHLQFEASAE